MSLGEAAAGLRARLDAKHRAREVGIRNARQAVRCSANAIRAAHRAELERAGELLAGYLLTLLGLGWRRSRRRRALAAAARPAWAAWWAPPASWGGQVPLSTE